MVDGSLIADINLSKSQNSDRRGQSTTLSLRFKVDGTIREAFNQKNWERAYDKHDNGFRMTIEVDIKSGGRVVLPIKFVRKAVLFWTRNPKIPHRIWVSIIKDDAPFYPLAMEEARSFLFDVNKVIELSGNDFLTGTHTLYAEITVSWGKHEYTEPAEIRGRSNEVVLMRVATQNVDSSQKSSL